MVSTERWDGALVHPQRKMEGTQSNQYTKWGGPVWEIQGRWTEGKAREDDWQVGYPGADSGRVWGGGLETAGRC